MKIWHEAEILYWSGLVQPTSCHFPVHVGYFPAVSLLRQIGPLGEAHLRQKSEDEERGQAAKDGEEDQDYTHHSVFIIFGES